MNKEIEYLLNEMKDTTQDYIGTNGCKYQDLLREELDLLLSYIEQLEKKIDQYENPDDLTLFYMWLDEKAKDKMKQLENNRDKAIDYLEKSKLNQLDTHCKYLYIDFGVEKIENIDELIDILKGDSDEV